MADEKELIENPEEEPQEESELNQFVAPPEEINDPAISQEKIDEIRREESKRWQRGLTKARQRDTEELRQLRADLETLKAQGAFNASQTPTPTVDDATRQGEDFVVGVLDKRLGPLLREQVFKPVATIVGNIYKGRAKDELAVILKEYPTLARKLSPAAKEEIRDRMAEGMVRGEDPEVAFFTHVAREKILGSALGEAGRNAPPITETSGASGNQTESAGQELSREEMQKIFRKEGEAGLERRLGGVRRENY